MNKAELVAAIAAKSAQSQTDTNKFVDGFCEAVMEALANGEQVALVGFGTFKVGERAARKGRNPRTGTPIDIAASKSPKFTVGKIFKDKVSSSKPSTKENPAKKLLRNKMPTIKSLLVLKTNRPFEKNFNRFATGSHIRLNEELNLRVFYV